MLLFVQGGVYTGFLAATAGLITHIGGDVWVMTLGLAGIGIFIVSLFYERKPKEVGQGHGHETGLAKACPHSYTSTVHEPGTLRTANVE